MTGPTERFPDPEARTTKLPTGDPGTASRIPGADALTTPLVAPGARAGAPSQPLAGQDTAPIPVPSGRVSELPPGRAGFWRELSGSLSLGLCVLALVVAGMQILAWRKGMPGPGALIVLGHLAAAVIAVVLQRGADRRAGAPGLARVFLILAITAAAVWMFWLA